VGKKGKPTKRGIVLVKPGKKSIENLKRNIKSKLRFLRNAAAWRVVKALNPIIRG
jgi:hypothetical protein